MNAKLEQGQYKDRFEFEADFRLMVSNAKTYNVAGSFVHSETLALESFFEASAYFTCSNAGRNLKLALQRGCVSTRPLRRQARRNKHNHLPARPRLQSRFLPHPRPPRPRLLLLLLLQHPLSP